ncbi:MAG TPA: cytochrome c peroxidase [Pirellulales bacterium]|nr:cytochrome c peroxidase [Pirellulales bacterium]
MTIPKSLTLRFLSAGALVALAAFGCAERKQPDAPPNTTDVETITVEAVVVDEPEPEMKDEPSNAPPAPETKQEPKDEPKEGPKSEPPMPKDEPAAAEKQEAASGKVLLGSPELTAGIPGEGPLKVEEIEKWLADPANHEPLDFELPMGLATGAAQIKGVDKNPLTRAKIELGRQLYFDPRLSADVSISCASCHNPDEGFARHTQFGEGIKGLKGGRNSPVSYNRILSDKQFWDGRAGSLEEQAVGPIANPIEMGHTHEACVACLQAVPGYEKQFAKIFGRLDIGAVGEALASFERAIVTEPAPFDYYERLRPFEQLEQDDIEADADLKAKYDEAKAGAETHPMSESAKRGRELFFTDKGGCSACHVGANLTDEKYHNIGVGMDAEKPDIGREDTTKDPKDRGAFKTPTIRNVATSAPYMHDGSQKTLEEVVDFYAKGGHPNPNLDEKIKKLDLSDQDKQDLVEFMKQGCSSNFPKVNPGRLPE